MSSARAKRKRKQFKKAGIGERRITDVQSFGKARQWSANLDRWLTDKLRTFVKWLAK